VLRIPRERPSRRLGHACSEFRAKGPAAGWDTRAQTEGAPRRGSSARAAGAHYIRRFCAAPAVRRNDLRRFTRRKSIEFSREPKKQERRKARANKEVISLCRDGAALSGAAPFLRSGAEPVLLRICTEFFLLFLCRKVDRSGCGEADVRLYADVSAGTAGRRSLPGNQKSPFQAGQSGRLLPSTRNSL